MNSDSINQDPEPGFFGESIFRSRFLKIMLNQILISTNHLHEAEGLPVRLR